MAREAQRSMGDLAPVLEETIECHRVVKVFGGQEYESRRFERANQAVRGFNIRQTIAASLTDPITHVLASVALAVIVYLAMEQSLAARTTVGEFASFLTAMLMLLAPLKHLTEIQAPLQRGLAAAESVFGMIDTPVEEDRGTVVLPRARGELAYERVGFTYPTRDEGRTRHADRRERRAALRRTAPAPGHRPRAAEERPGADPRRGDVLARYRVGAPRAGCARHPDARAHHHRHCAPALHRRARRP